MGEHKEVGTAIGRELAGRGNGWYDTDVKKVDIGSSLDVAPTVGQLQLEEGSYL